MIIPARAGSKGILNKNRYLLCGKPLIEYTIDVVREAGLKYVITTDDPQIKDNYLFTIDRPKELATDTSHIVDEIKRLDSIKFLKHESYMLLQPTSPLRRYEHLLEAIELFNESQADCLYSGYNLKLKTKDKLFDKHKSESHFQRNGSIFITKRELILEGKMWNDNVFEYEMPYSFSVDIDNMDEMYVAESLILNNILGEDYYEEEEE